MFFTCQGFRTQCASDPPAHLSLHQARLKWSTWQVAAEVDSVGFEGPHWPSSCCPCLMGWGVPRTKGRSRLEFTTPVSRPDPRRIGPESSGHRLKLASGASSPTPPSSCPGPGRPRGGLSVGGMCGRCLDVHVCGLLATRDRAQGDKRRGGRGL